MNNADIFKANKNLPHHFYNKRTLSVKVVREEN